jgi:hypothetical protein
MADLVSGSVRAEVREVEVPVKLETPSISLNISTPAVEFPLPCGFKAPPIPGLAILSENINPITLFSALLGIPIPMIELPTICPELRDAAIVAIILAAGEAGALPPPEPGITEYTATRP